MDSDMIYDFPCTSCQENGLNSDSVSYCEQCEKSFCTICVKMHHRILKDHTILDKSDQHLWLKETDSVYDTIEPDPDDGNKDIGQEQDSRDIVCEVLDNPLTTLCGIVGEANMSIDHEGIRITRSDRKAFVEIPLNMIRRYGRKRDFMFFFEIGSRFSFGEGSICTRCCSRQEAKLANSYMDIASGKTN
ncbi:uncharacterized protein LOC128221054 isoform X2 [Mya arenaria]|uniref:uncharacterized protein LOC128221054 isoform X2 n=1 Tax=Mya arenaria TaxID=6604 RepID=UPI0022DE9D92|nr:uncharacterized protein LOC128221054 isoform X2 [Mya arenaria]